MIERKSQFILKSFVPNNNRSIALKYINNLFDVDIYYRELLRKFQAVISCLDVNFENELIKGNKILFEEEITFFNRLNCKYMSMTIIKKLSGHNNIYEIRLDGGEIYPRILFSMYNRRVLMMFGITKHIETKGFDGVIERINELAYESELICIAISGSRINRDEYLGKGDDSIEIKF